MKRLNLLLTLVLLASITFAGTIRKTYYFSIPKIEYNNGYHTITFQQTLLTGIAGEPALPYYAVSLLIPPGEVATSVEFIGENEVALDGNFKLFPYQKFKNLFLMHINQNFKLVIRFISQISTIPKNQQVDFQQGI